MRKTIVELDLVGYSTICDILEQGLGVGTVAQLNQQIQSFINDGLDVVGANRDSTVMADTGDGAILFFEIAEIACRFVESVHAATHKHNARLTQASAKRVFRVGAATGEVEMQAKPGGGFAVAGTAIARAVRLESNALPGGLLVDEETFKNLPEYQQLRFGRKKTVPGKRDEQFTAYPSQWDTDGLQDAADIAGENKKAPLPEIPRAAGLDKRREIAERFKRLKSRDYIILILYLGIPPGQQPPDTLILDDQMKHIIRWAIAEEKLDELLEYLRDLTK